MSLLSPRADYQIRHANKDPQWSSLCNNVFDQYLDTDDLFGFEPGHYERSSSNDSGNLFDFSGASEQSHQTDATSPIPSWEPGVQESQVEAKQPKAKEPVDFWNKTLKALERNAAESERAQQQLRSTKSHPDFLSLGGYPSPPVIPSSPTDQSFSAQRRVSRFAANGRKRNVTARSVSRGRPSERVSKPTVAGSVNPSATVRRCSASPTKMMNPSRYRAGFRDVWVDKLRSSPKKYELRVPSSGRPMSPPPSARAPYDDFAAFGSPNNMYPHLPIYDDQMSPLTNTFQHAHIHTLLASPSINALAYANNSYFEPIPPPLPNPYSLQAVASNDTAPLYLERTPPLAADGIQDFDFGFTKPPDVNPWSTTTFTEPAAHYTTNHVAVHNPFGAIDPSILPTTETTDFAAPGLGISCDPSLMTNFNTVPDGTTLSPTALHPATTATTSRHLRKQPHGLPSTPHHRRSKSCVRSQSPSPPATEPRSRRAATSRRTSWHRRTKSSSSTPRQPQNQDRSGFVNFTPHDSNKILSGVAPSGSSKTKARREKEAADKRRRLSQAAVKAIVEAGDDLDSLSKAGLLVEREDREDSLFVEE